jgi:hypothetical protein
MLGWHPGGRAVYAANEALIDVMIAFLESDTARVEIEKEFLEVGTFIFDLYRGVIYSTYQEPIWTDRPNSQIVKKSVPITNLSWRQRRRLRAAVTMRLNRYIAEELKRNV